MILLIQDLKIRVVNPITGELLRGHVLNPHVDYQTTGAPKGPTRRHQELSGTDTVWDPIAGG